jgi:hypothetical protein
MPPMPEPMMTPARKGSTPAAPAWSIACTLAAMASWQKRSALRASLGSIATPGSNPFTSAAMVVLYPSVSKAVMRSTPDRPARTAAQVDSRSRPTAVTRPMPVITTLRCVISHLHA